MSHQSANAPRLAATGVVPLENLIGPPPKGFAPLDQFREAQLLTAEPHGCLSAHLSADSRTGAQLVQHYRYENNGENYEERIRQMVDRGGWAEADAVVVELGLCLVPDGIGLAVRERHSVAVAFCHGMAAPIARVGL